MLEGFTVLNPPRVLRLLVALRWCAIAMQLAVIVIAWQALGIARPGAAGLAVPACLTLWNVISLQRLRGSADVAHGEIALQLGIDTIALTVLLYFSGGAGSPFTSLYLLPIAIGASAMPPFRAWSMTLWCAACYSLLLWLQPGWTHAAHTGRGEFFQLHVIGMWVNFLLGALLLTAALTTLAAMLRRREQELADAREQRLRDEHIVATGALAAGTAHELNTPLSTMAVLTGELRRNPDLTEDERADLDLLAGQITECKHRIRDMLARTDTDTTTTLPALLDRCIERWRTTRPETVIRLARPIATLPPAPVPEQALIGQALCTLLDNAADASAEAGSKTVGMDFRVTDARLEIAVEDDGPDLPPDRLEGVGQHIHSEKPHGFGLGLILARTGIRHLGGEITIAKRASRGLRATITLPLPAPA